jgi:hypothetical protein
MTDPQCRPPHHYAGVPTDRGVPDCDAGPFGRLRFVARELAALHSTGEE